jgi:hypothetical protein
MGINAGEIEGLLARFGNEIVNEQVNWATPFVGNGHIQKIKHTHEIGIVRIRSSDGLSSTGQIEDGGLLPQGSNVSFEKGSYMPKIFFTRLSIPRAAAHLAAGGRDGVRLVREEIEVAGRQLGQVLGQAVFRQPILRPYGAGAGTTGITTIDTGAVAAAYALNTERFCRVKTLAGLYVGQFVSCLTATAAPNQLPQFEITSINFNINQSDDGTPLTDTAGSQLAVGFWTIGLTKRTGAASENIVESGTTDTGAGVPSVDVPGAGQIQVQVLAGGTALPVPATSTLEPMVSLSDCYSNGGLYGIVQGNFTGNTTALVNGLTIKSMRDMSTQIKRRAGAGWHMLVMNSSVLQRYFETGVTGPNDTFTNWLPGQTMKDADGGNMMPTFQGQKIVVDENSADEDMYFFNKDDIKLAEFKDFATDKDGGGESGMVDRRNLIYDTQIWGMYNMRCTRRNSGGLLTNIYQAAV